MGLSIKKTSLCFTLLVLGLAVPSLLVLISYVPSSQWMSRRDVDESVEVSKSNRDGAISRGDPNPIFVVSMSESKPLSAVGQSDKDHLDSASKNAIKLSVVESDSDKSDAVYHTYRDSHSLHCTFDVCFDLGRCPLTRPFSVYVYDLPVGEKEDLISGFVRGLKETNSYTSDPDRACVFVAILQRRATEDLQTEIHSLSHWGTDGENHLLIELSTSKDTASMLEGVSTGKAIVSRSVVSQTPPFRADFDILLPPLPKEQFGWRDLYPILPISRKNFVYFHGDYVPPQHPSSGSISPAVIKSLQQALEGMEKVDIELQCPEPGTGVAEGVGGGEWKLCGDQNSRLQLCSQSMFSLILGPGGPRNGMGVSLYTRLTESLICGSIPVVVGVGILPFDEVIEWSRAAIIIPLGRFSDVYHILNSLSHRDIESLRLQGRHLWRTYFSSPLTVVQNSVAIVRSRTLHPPPLAPDFTGEPLLSLGGASAHKSIPSSLYSHNFTTYSSDFWNSVPGPLFSYPSTPFNPGLHFSKLNKAAVSHLLTEVEEEQKLIETDFKDDHLINIPDEQFTVVILTYRRNKVLMEGLAKLKGIPSMQKVIVVWNNEEAPPKQLKWPDIGVPIKVVRGKGNTLNNKFLPFKEIETEAVLSLDDDVLIQPAEIEFAFRVWCEAKDRLVGFPGRSHSYSFPMRKWIYALHNCKSSMFLTNGAFIHKIYFYLFTYWLPKEVKDLIDKHMNCEDIAMNFLVAHFSRKPHIKVPTNYDFYCGHRCPQNLSIGPDRTEQRRYCIEFFASVYGYMPLLYTQFRADPVLSKNPPLKDIQLCAK